jgi:hypothetical protein
VIPNARLCRALLDRITDRAHILETGTESYRFRRTLKSKKRSRSNLTVESRGNDGPWKAWKTKDRFCTLPTAFGNRRAIPTFPPLQLLLLYKEATNLVRQKPSPKNQQLRGGPKQTAKVGRIQLPNALRDRNAAGRFNHMRSPLSNCYPETVPA